MVCSWHLLTTDTDKSGRGTCWNLLNMIEVVLEGMEAMLHSLFGACLLYVSFSVKQLSNAVEA